MSRRATFIFFFLFSKFYFWLNCLFDFFVSFSPCWHLRKLDFKCGWVYNKYICFVIYKNHGIAEFHLWNSGNWMEIYVWTEFFYFLCISGYCVFMFVFFCLDGILFWFLNNNLFLFFFFFLKFKIQSAVRDLRAQLKPPSIQVPLIILISLSCWDISCNIELNCHLLYKLKLIERIKFTLLAHSLYVDQSQIYITRPNTCTIINKWEE